MNLIKISKLEKSFPNSNFSSPHMRACMLGYAGVDYLTACIFLVENHEQVGPLFNLMLPAMHQTMELLTKAVTFMSDSSFDPMKYSHHVQELLNAYSRSVPVFASMLADPDTVELLENLEESYLGVRYGECTVFYDGEALQLFKSRAEELLDVLFTLTGVCFLPKHFAATKNQ